MPSIPSRFLLFAAAAAAALLMPSPAAAQDEDFELWINPSVSFALNDETALEFEVARRLRDADAGRADTVYGRFWVNQKLSRNVTVSGGAERRINEPGDDETRLLQQVTTSHGILRTRLRLEQRLVDDQRLGLRVRSRIGVEVPLDENERLAFESSAELFVTLRATSADGEDGLTGLRTQIGASYEVSDNLAVSLAYLRQQEFTRGGPDRVGHAPVIGVELSF